MEKSTKIKHKVGFLLSNDALSSQSTQTAVKSKKECSECNKIRKPSTENNQICYTCNKAKKRIISSGNKVIDDFIKYTNTNCPNKNGKMVFVPYEKFKNIEFIGEGGFSQIFKATWIDCQITDWGALDYTIKKYNRTVALKKLNNSKNITSKELNELKMYYHYSLNWKSSNNNCDIHNSYVNIYYGITQDPITQDLIFIMPYHNSDLAHYITKDFYNISWHDKISKLEDIIKGLSNIHDANIIHRDLHSGNILVDGQYSAKLCDLGTSKSATDNDDNNEIHGIIPFIAPEVLQGKKYTRASDIYSYGMIMWEIMVGRRPFWDRKHNTELIIDTCNGLRPPIVTNAPEGYIDLMKECWHDDPEKRPTANEILEKINRVYANECKNETKIIESSDIGPVIRNNSGKRKFEGIQFENNFINGESIKKIKLIEDKNDDYLTREIEFDFDINSKRVYENEYATREIDFDIGAL
ncbi:hypothetical protein RclHR1_03340013 [Rhizophagus clarus]|uniref:Protein kinase domain-containing protein n=1 Tax=Rhizophagus clarus TaxID=94130 RepID=A0A2Z6RD16_9GLOM|nr:hypothetical protein RclHR1_03340013 [Rhizophagus clarus]